MRGSMLSNIVAASHMWLFNLKSKTTKIQILSHTSHIKSSVATYNYSYHFGEYRWRIFSSWQKVLLN